MTRTCSSLHVQVVDQASPGLGVLAVDTQERSPAHPGPLPRPAARLRRLHQRPGTPRRRPLRGAPRVRRGARRPGHGKPASAGRPRCPLRLLPRARARRPRRLVHQRAVPRQQRSHGLPPGPPVHEDGGGVLARLRPHVESLRQNGAALREQRAQEIPAAASPGASRSHQRGLSDSSGVLFPNDGSGQAVARSLYLSVRIQPPQRFAEESVPEFENASPRSGAPGHGVRHPLLDPHLPRHGEGVP